MVENSGLASGPPNLTLPYFPNARNTRTPGHGNHKPYVGETKSVGGKVKDLAKGVLRWLGKNAHEDTDNHDYEKTDPKDRFFNWSSFSLF
jgi:hypothetical protein